MKIAVVGCAHGELDKIYEAVEHLQNQRNLKIDLLLCCGDFQAVRNHGDLTCMAVPPKYRQMNSFYKYYSGEAKAPVLTVFIGGNHEASNYLSELPYGGWVAPDIYYMGLAGVVRFGNLRIGGISGIFKGLDYFKGHFERPPYDQNAIRSVYHVRNLEIFRMQQLTNNKIGIFLSHDWPRGIHAFGNEKYLFKRKPYFREEAERNCLGSPPLLEVLNKLMPTYWFSAHMHVKYSAFYTEQPKDEKNSDNNKCSAESGNSSSEPKKSTKFLALDKCLPRREYLQILDLPEAEFSEKCSAGVLLYDPEWLAVLKSTDHLLKTTKATTYMPGPGCTERYDFRPTLEELTEINNIFGENYEISKNIFRRTAAGHFDGAPKRHQTASFAANPQTAEFCQKLKITNLNAILANVDPSDIIESFTDSATANPDEISIDDVESESEYSCRSHACAKNPDEISVSDDDNDDFSEISKMHLKTSVLSKPPSCMDNFVPPELHVTNIYADDNSSKTPVETENSKTEFPVFKRRNAAMYSESKVEDDD